MLLNLTLRNFKIWETTGLIRMAPVTLLLGTNSSGKSSIIQSLLLIRQTIRSKEPNVSLHFGVEGTSDSVALGQFDDVLSRHGSSKEIEIEFTWSPDGATEDAFTFSGAYNKDPTGAAVISRLRLGQGSKAFTVTRQQRGAFKLTMGGKHAPLATGRDLHPQNSFTFSTTTLARLPVEDAKEIREAGTALLQELERILYLGPVRQLAKRHYIWDGVPPSSLGDDGERAMDVLIASGLLAKRGKAGGELFLQTGQWLKKMGLATGLDVERVGRSSLYQLIIQGESDSRSNLKDVGVGVSQVLPVIVACLFAPSGHTVIVEEPESHLHPLAQSTLAELFVEVSKERNIQVIAETHSEHLFRRIQTLIAKGVHANHCSPYFVEREKHKARLLPLEVDFYGRIKNWPPKFFGDSLGETKIQTELMIEKLKEQKNDAPTD